VHRGNLEAACACCFAELSEQQAEPHIGAIVPIQAHGIMVTDAWERSFAYRLASILLNNFDEQLFDKLHHIFFSHKRHLNIELRKFWLPIGTQVFVPKASCDLKIPVQTSNHKQLLELLRCLWQRIKTVLGTSDWARDSRVHLQVCFSSGSAFRLLRMTGHPYSHGCASRLCAAARCFHACWPGGDRGTDT